MSGDGGHSIGRRLSAWRRLLLLFGPRSAKQVGLVLTEFAWASYADAEANLIAKNCRQKTLLRLCDYKDDRGLRAQLRILEDAGWIERDDVQTGPGTLREYALKIPKSVPQSARDELANPSPGMWKRLLQANTERTPESEDRCYSHPEPPITGNEIPLIDTADENHRKTDSGSPELKRTNTGNEIPDHRNSDSPLEEVLDSSYKDQGEGQAPKRVGNGIRPNGRQPGFAELFSACQDAGVSGSDWNAIADVIEAKFGFLPSEKQYNSLQGQLNDQAGK